MSYDTWRTTEDDPFMFDPRCDDCKQALAHCCCPIPKEPLMDETRRLLAEAWEALDENAAAGETKAGYYKRLEVAHAIEAAQHALDRYEIFVAQEQEEGK